MTDSDVWLQPRETRTDTFNQLAISGYITFEVRESTLPPAFVRTADPGNRRAAATSAVPFGPSLSDADRTSVTTTSV